MNGSPRLSFSISTTPAMSYTGISSSRSSTPIMTSAASCRSMSTTPSARVPSRSCCAPARPRRVSRCAPICAGSCAISANVGPGRASPSGATALCPARGDGMVRGQPHRLRLRAARSEAAGEENRRGGGRGAHRARFVEQARRARLRRNAPQGQSWSRERRAVARIEATPLGLDTRFVVTNVEYGAAEWIYAALYCATPSRNRAI